MFGTSKKQCPVCKQDVEEEKAVKRGDEWFCSEEHAEEHSKMSNEGESKKESHGGCCG